MSDTEVNIYALDAAYKPFPTFEEWASQTSVDTVRWQRYTSSLKDRAELSPEVLDRARQIAKRAAALDTGAIEGLYEVDRGFTFTVAFETSALEAAFAKKGEHVRSLFEAQLHAYDYVLDLATKSEPISEAAVRALHEVVCRAQSTYSVMTAVGPQLQPLPTGQYKALPNHVRTRKGTNHSYAPVDVTPPEMARLVGELRSEAFLAAHPVLQASYAHYGLVVIHPFADGNGRVARALASAFTYRAISMPIVILSEHKNAYLNALESADSGDHQVFVDFMLARSLDTIKLVDESVRSALSPSTSQGMAAIKGLYLTRGGFTHDQVDAAGAQLINALVSELKTAAAINAAPKLTINVMVAQNLFTVKDSAYRAPMGNEKSVRVVINSAPPASAQVHRDYNLWLPRDAAGDDDILLKSDKPVDTLVARMDEVVPDISGVLQIRLNMFADRILGEMLAELKPLAEKSLRGGVQGVRPR
jgi:Fic family protein